MSAASRWYPIAALPLLLAACATSDDPREGGFFGGVGGLSSGRYEERVQSRQSSLDSVRTARAGLQAEQSGLESQKTASQRRLQAERKKFATLESETRDLSAKVGALKAEDAQRQAQIADLKQRIADLESRIQAASRSQGADALEGSGAPAGDQDVRRQQLEAQRRQLEQEYRMLTDLYLKLGS